MKLPGVKRATLPGRCWGLAAVLVLAGACGSATEEVQAIEALSPDVRASVDCLSLSVAVLDGTPAVVFMDPDAGPEQIRDVENFLVALRQVSGLRYVDQQEALAEFRQLFADNPDLVQQVTAEVLPTSFRFKLDSATLEEPVAEIESLPGVDQVLLRDPLGCLEADPELAARVEANIEGRWQGTDVAIWVDPERGDDVQDIEQALLGSENVTRIMYVSQDQARQEFNCLFQDEPDLLESASEVPLPSSFRVGLASESDSARTIEEIRGFAGVRDVLLRPTVESIVSGVTPAAAFTNYCPVKGEWLVQ